MKNEGTIPDHILIFPDKFGNIQISAGYDDNAQCDRVVIISPDDAEIVCQWIKSCKKRMEA